MKKASRQMIDLWHRMWSLALFGDLLEFWRLAAIIRADFPGDCHMSVNCNADTPYLSVGLAMTEAWKREILRCGF